MRRPKAMPEVSGDLSCCWWFVRGGAWSWVFVGFPMFLPPSPFHLMAPGYFRLWAFHSSQAGSRNLYHLAPRVCGFLFVFRPFLGGRGVGLVSPFSGVLFPPRTCLRGVRILKNIRVGVQAGDSHAPFSAQEIAQRGRGIAKASQRYWGP